uniref:Lysosomal-associated transmembrane protein 4B n=1 Tax=Pyxicephalus adspersus TaxID=30357 RepID=A0AAV3APR8_PYXAD|nr:TPA: hypothetical protein GDO54_011799 [Pyxicephalus adspersus]
MKMYSPWARFYSNSCCLCCHVRTGTIILGVWYLIINSLVLLILLSALADPDLYHLPSNDIKNEFYYMDEASNFPYKEEILSVNPTCLVVIILCFMSIILAFKAYLISCVWNCYRYINSRNSSDVLVYVTTNDTTVLLPQYEDSGSGTSKEPPPPYMSA